MQHSNREQFEQYVIGAFPILSNQFSRFADSLHSEVTFRQWYMLMMISRMEDNPKNVRDIAEFMGTSRQNVKKMLVALEEKGYVTCARSASDGRALDIDLTGKAYRYLNDGGSAVERKINELFEPFSDAELTALAGYIDKLTACLVALDEE